MRPTICWGDLAGARVGLWGLGVEGEASLRRCRALGVEPVLVDDRPVGRDAGRNVLATRQGGLDALSRCDVVVKAPGISRYRDDVRSLTDAGVVVAGGLALWFAEADLARVLAVTGTKGKSTTTAVAGHMLATSGGSVLVCGNIGIPPYDPAVSSDVDWYVVEVSSYQAADVAVAPPVVAVTSLHPDHLPWHAADVETYYRDKLSLCSQPGARVTVANGDSELLRARADMLAPDVRWVRDTDEPDAAWASGFGPGRHNRRNALIARRALAEMGIDVPDEALTRAAATYQPLAHRLQPVHERDGVLFVDDSLSTNVLPTLAAVEAFPDRRVALLVGGHDRGVSYEPLAEGLRARRQPLLLLAMPDNGDRIVREVRALGAGEAVEVRSCDGLESAVREGYAWARPDGVVLLSPAAASFGRYADYAARGDAFAAAARASA